MGNWIMKSGRIVELIFDEDGNFIKFGIDVSDDEAENIKQEINTTLREGKTNG